jgi:hypothetical protein
LKICMKLKNSHLRLQITIHLRGYMSGIHPAYDIHAFHAMVTVRCGKLELAYSRFCYHAHLRLHYIKFACEADDKIFFYIHFLFVIFINIFN